MKRLELFNLEKKRNDWCLTFYYLQMPPSDNTFGLLIATGQVNNCG